MLLSKVVKCKHLMTSPGGNRMTSSQICRFQSYSDSIGLKITTVCTRFFFSFKQRTAGFKLYDKPVRFF